MDEANDSSTVEFDALGDVLEAEFGEPDKVTEEVESTPEEGEKSGEEEAPAEEKESTETEDTPEKESPAEDDDVDKSEPEEKFSPKDAIKEALRELEQEGRATQQTRQSLREEVRSAYFPNGLEGVVDVIKDSEGKPITGVGDIAGKLINPETDEVFTWEEAKQWYDTATQQQKDRINEAEQYLDSIAETHQSLHEGEQTVIAKYGELLKKLPDVAKEAFEGLQELLQKDPNTGIVVKAPDVVRYYDMIMRPYVSVARQLELQAQAEAEAKKAEDAKQSQSDRSDLPTSADGGGPDKKDDLDKAFDEYFNG